MNSSTYSNHSNSDNNPKVGIFNRVQQLIEREATVKSNKSLLYLLHYAKAYDEFAGPARHCACVQNSSFRKSVSAVASLWRYLSHKPLFPDTNALPLDQLLVSRITKQYFNR